jgi:hypothetical protein
VANVLGDNGVTVHPVTTTADATGAAPGATVLITQPLLLTKGVVTDLVAAGPARIALVGDYPGSPTMTRLAAGVKVADGGPSGDDRAVEPGCQYPTAVRAGSAHLPGLRYDAQGWMPIGQACYSSSKSAALVVLPASSVRPEVVVLGSATPLTNDGFDDEGNASLILSLLGSRADLVWWQPNLDDPAIAASGGQTPLSELLPAWVVPVSVQLVVCTFAIAWWRSRRMGRLVPEPLPVVIRAGETTAGRARLLQASRARGTAADLLREQSRDQLCLALGLPSGCHREVLLPAAQARTQMHVEQLLFGPAPATDRQLIELQADLTNLVQEIRRS